MIKYLVSVFICYLLLSNMKGFSMMPLDTIKLSSVQITGYNLSQFNSAGKIEKISNDLISIYSYANIGDILMNTSNIGVNSYAGLTSVSIRGTGATHTAFVWNGFNIQNSLNGGVNLAQIPVTMIDNMSIQYGGCSALFGSGAIGGIIQLNNQLEYNKGFSTDVGGCLSSFGMQQENAVLKYSNSIYAGCIRIANFQTQNNFTFKNTAEFREPVDTEKNASQYSTQVLMDNQFRINSRQQVTTHIWYQNLFMHVPDAMTDSPEDGKEWDKNIRVTAEWQRTGESNNLYFRSAYFNEHMLYHSLIDSGNHRAITMINEAEGSLKFNECNALRYGTNYTWEKAVSDDYDTTHIRNRNAFFASYRLLSSSHNWNCTVNLREELVNLQTTPPTFSIGIINNINNESKIKLNLSKDYRIPEFDALYWQSALAMGNPNLKPESGYNADVNFLYAQKNNNFGYNFIITGYAGLVANWIIWQPNEEQIWQPSNIDKVFIRGAELHLGTNYHINNFSLQLEANYTLSYATQEKNDNQLDNAFIGKQLIYVPYNKGSLTVILHFKTLSFIYSHSFTGMRYYLPDNSLFVPAYNIGNLSLAYDFLITKSAFHLSFNIYNIWNESYQIMAWYPTPGRSYQIGLSYRFN